MIVESRAVMWPSNIRMCTTVNLESEIPRENVNPNSQQATWANGIVVRVYCLHCSDWSIAALWTRLNHFTLSTTWAFLLYLTGYSPS